VASWRELEEAEPRFASDLRRLLDAHVHKTLATLRRDGSPRISGTEVTFDGGELWTGSMAGSRKTDDLRRDARFALHSGSDDPPSWTGDAKLSGRLEEVADPARWAPAVREAMGAEPSGSVFRADIEEATIVRLDETGKALVIEHWREGRGLSRMTRD
jgi:pyridoxamine 5'-phosphate oxidase-like protein